MMKPLLLTLTGSLLLVSSAHAQQKLMLFGGQDHATYLGCLNCPASAADSVLNKFSPYGNQFGSNSIFNRFIEFGSYYSDESASSAYANDPPVIVDGNGNFYGRLTINQYNAQRARNERLSAWIAGVCQG
jgi:hypothetical protein